MYIYIIYNIHICIYVYIYNIHLCIYIYICIMSSHIESHPPRISGPRTAPSAAPPLGAMDAGGWPRWCPDTTGEATAIFQNSG